MQSDLIPLPGFDYCLSGDDTQIYMCSSDLSLELQTHLHTANAYVTVPFGCLIVLSNVAYPNITLDFLLPFPVFPISFASMAVLHSCSATVSLIFPFVSPPPFSLNTGVPNLSFLFGTLSFLELSSLSRLHKAFLCRRLLNLYFQLQHLSTTTPISNSVEHNSLFHVTSHSTSFFFMLPPPPNGHFLLLLPSS